MFNFLRKRNKDKCIIGVIPDPRPREEKEYDYQASEIMEFAPYTWKEKPESEWVKFPIFNQDRSSSCVGNAVAKVLGTENFLEENKFVHYSPRDIYTRRANFPGKGMYFKNAMEIGHKYGATIEQLMPSMNKDENWMNNSLDRKTIDEQIALVGRGGNYLTIPNNIDAAAHIIEDLHKSIVLGVRFGPGEWNKKVPLIKSNYTSSGHAVVATNATMYKGKKALVIEDSWGIDSGIDGRRIVTQDWFEKGRIIGLYYFEFLENTWRDKELKPEKPKHSFSNNLLYRNRGPEIVWLQKILKYEEFFPQNVNCTGFYGNITAKGVLDFQLKYKVADILELKKLNGRSVGPKTRAELNSIYA